MGSKARSVSQLNALTVTDAIIISLLCLLLLIIVSEEKFFIPVDNPGYASCVY